MDYIVIGEILKAQGIAGEIKVRSLSDDASRCKKLKIVYISNTPYKILSCRVNDEFVFLKLMGIDTRDTAQSLAGKLLEIDRVNAVNLDEGTYFIVDLIGCSILDENGDILGEITAVDQFGAADVITAKYGVSKSKTMRFPFLQKIVAKVDVAQKKFVVFKQKLDEVCVYED